ncbi:hypothetical protein Ciccas_010701 [Cichlidogyrus casuarinus]|uniref:Uncharacterized protein n=1 Tax=Cichlidogyrus casuarinus TaxID=1844966 RepID=A0ABD2PTC4_9PLAT
MLHWRFSATDWENLMIKTNPGNKQKTVPINDNSAIIDGLDPCTAYTTTATASQNSATITSDPVRVTTTPMRAGPIATINVEANNGQEISISLVDDVKKSICGEYEYQMELADRSSGAPVDFQRSPTAS